MLAWKRGLGVSKFEGIVSPAYSVFRFFESANPDYMHYLLLIDLYTGHFKTRSTGVIDSRLRLYPDSFFDTSLIVPPLPEQTQIAAFLDHETAKIDRLIEKQQALISLLKEKRQAVISHAVTKGLNPHAPLKDSGIKWLGQVPAHWRVLGLGKVVDLMANGSSANQTDEAPNTVAVTRIESISGGTLNFEKVGYVRRAEIPSGYRLQPGDILFSNINLNSAVEGWFWRG